LRLIVAFVVVLAAGAGIVAWTAGGSEGSSDEVPEYGVGPVRAGSVAALADCGDWNEGTDAERWVTIEDIHNQLNQAVADGPKPNLPPEEAYALFERSCSRDYAVGFRLYKLYGRAAAFGLLDQ
jgi:hypothetical protein